MWQEGVRRSVTALAAAGLFIGPGAVPAGAASVLEVPGAYATIQAALDAAVAGDTIRVAPGTYHEQVTIGKEVTLESSGGAGVTSITWEPSTAVVLRQPGAVIRGFTITGGGRHAHYGGGVRLVGGSHAIEDVILRDSMACFGAGIHVGDGSLLLTRATFENNTNALCDEFEPPLAGPGMFVAGGVVTITDSQFGTAAYPHSAGLSVQGGSVVVERSVLSRPDALHWRPGVQVGGGTLTVRHSEALLVHIDGAATVTIEDSRIGGTGKGQVIVSGGASLNLIDSVVYSDVPAALYTVGGTAPNTVTLLHSTVVAGPEGTAFAVAKGDSASVTASILQGGWLGAYCEGSIQFASSVVYRPGTPINPPEALCSASDLTGAILADPGLAGWPYDARLRPGGAAVDLVDDVPWPVDLEGTARPLDGDGDGTAWSDAGAWELVARGIAGRVMSQNLGSGLGGVCVAAWADDTGSPVVAGTTQTGPEGTFFLGLAGGTYRLSFEDCRDSIYASTWHGGTSFATATPVEVAAEVAAIGDVWLAVGQLCLGKAASIVGTQGDDTITGTAGGDVILGFGGKDTIRGLGGDDTLCGGVGIDRLEGGPGSDGLDGGEDDDRLFGHDGNDRLFGGSGVDELQGGPGDDRLAGGDDNDELVDREGSNSHDGGPGDDLIRGGQGNDRYVGGRGIDTVDLSDARGGVVIDLLAGLSTGDGDDTWRGVENLIGTDFSDQMTGNRRGNRLEGGEGDDLLDGGAGNDVLLGGSGVDVLIGGPGADRLVSGEGSGGVIAGGPGDDVIEGGYGDLISGDRGRDNIAGGDGPTEIYGGGEADVIHGGGHLWTYDDENYIDGGSGDDRLFGGGCRDTLVGGPGDDFIDPGESPGYDVVWGGPGNDTISAGADERGEVYVSYALAAGPVVADLASGVATGEGRDRLVGVIDGLIGSHYDDVLRGTTESDELLDGGPGDDYIDGRSGRDKIAGFTGNDLLVGGADIDDLFGEEGDDRIMGDAGKDYLDGYLGTDSLDGGPDDDICVDGEALTSCEEEYYRLAHRLPEFPRLVPWRRARGRAPPAVAAVTPPPGRLGGAPGGRGR